MANPLHPEPGPIDRTCGDCVWRFDGGRGPAVSRCRRHGGQRVSADTAACAAFTAALDCLRCGACCREAYHAVEVGARDPFVKLHPDRLVRVHGRWNVSRRGGVCGCLEPEAGTWPCAVYDDRPKTCRSFEQGSANCVDARVRLNITL